MLVEPHQYPRRASAGRYSADAVVKARRRAAADDPASSTSGGNGHIVGTFESDLDPSLLPLPAGETVVPETRVGFGTSMPSTAAIALAFSTASGISIIAINRVCSLRTLSRDAACRTAVRSSTLTKRGRSRGVGA